MRNTQNNQGFSLVELMVVVAIIGILASVAIPQYSKFQAKARQTEAKSLLASVYTAEKGFFVEANGYTGCLSAIGVSPELTGPGTGINVGYYALGFDSTPAILASSAAGLVASPPQGSLCDVAAGEQGITHWLAAKNAATPAAVSTITRSALAVTGITLGVTNTAGSETFNVAAAGFVSQDSSKNTDTQCDHWTVNERNQMVNSRVGI